MYVTMNHREDLCLEKKKLLGCCNVCVCVCLSKFLVYLDIFISTSYCSYEIVKHHISLSLMSEPMTQDCQEVFLNSKGIVFGAGIVGPIQVFSGIGFKTQTLGKVRWQECGFAHSHIATLGEEWNHIQTSKNKRSSGSALWWYFKPLNKFMNETSRNKL